MSPWLQTVVAALTTASATSICRACTDHERLEAGAQPGKIVLSIPTRRLTSFDPKKQTPHETRSPRAPPGYPAAMPDRRLG